MAVVVQNVMFCRQYCLIHGTPYMRCENTVIIIPLKTILDMRHNNRIFYIYDRVQTNNLL